MNKDIIGAIIVGAIALVSTIIGILKRDSHTRYRITNLEVDTKEQISEIENRIRPLEDFRSSGEVHIRETDKRMETLERKIDDHYDKTIAILLEIKGSQK